jgi:hypothetical protein
MCLSFFVMLSSSLCLFRPRVYLWSLHTHENKVRALKFQLPSALLFEAWYTRTDQIDSITVNSAVVCSAALDSVSSPVLSNTLLLVLASTVDLGFWSHRDPWPYFFFFPVFFLVSKWAFSFLAEGGGGRTDLSYYCRVTAGCRWLTN